MGFVEIPAELVDEVIGVLEAQSRYYSHMARSRSFEKSFSTRYKALSTDFSDLVEKVQIEKNKL